MSALVEDSFHTEQAINRLGQININKGRRITSSK